MGTKLAQALATVVVEDFKEKFLRETPKKPLLWQRYIDDVLTFWPHTESEFTQFVHGLNSLTPRLHFTHTVLPYSTKFLDLPIYTPQDFPVSGRLSTSIFCKPTNTFSYALGSTYVSPHTLKGIAIRETLNLNILKTDCYVGLRRSDTQYRCLEQQNK